MDDSTTGPDLDAVEQMTTEEAQLITSMRIYDVLLGMYTEMSPEKAEVLMDIHAEGRLVGPVPLINLDFDTADVDEK